MTRLSTIGEHTEPTTDASPTVSTENFNHDRALPTMELAVRASQHGNVETLRFFLNGHVSADELDHEGCGLMHWAAINNKSDIIRLLLSYHADINVVGGTMRATPLHWACYRAQLGAIVTLATNGADASIRNTNGETPLHVAAYTGNTMVIAYMLVKFAHTKDLRDSAGRSALMIAAKSSFGLFPTRVFLKMDVFPDFTDDHTGDTAMHILMQRQNYRGVVEMLCAGADETIVNNDGQTPFQLAEKKKVGRHIKWHAKSQEVRENGSCFERMTAPWYIIQFITGVISGVGIGAVCGTYYFTNFWVLLVAVVVGFVILGLVGKQMQIEHLGLLPATYIIWMGCAELTLLIVESNGFVHWGILVTMCAIWAISASFYWTLILTNPGVLERSDDPFPEFIQNVEEYNVDRYCFTCWIPRTQTSRHCAQCDKCVDGFDHHCPWIHKCVYRQNLRVFILFCVTCLAFSALYSIVLAYIAGVSLASVGFQRTIDDHGLLVVSLGLSLLHLLGATGITYTQLAQLSRRVTTIEMIKKAMDYQYSNSDKSHQEEEHKPSIKDRIRNVWYLLAFDRFVDEEDEESETSSTSERSSRSTKETATTDTTA